MANFNHNGNNFDLLDFNCGGYALNSFDWYHPNRRRHSVGRYRGDTLESCTTTMLQDYPDLRVINDLQEVQPNEYAIAFRLSATDFHFMKQEEGSLWTHKMGGGEIQSIPQSEVFSDHWYPDYDGDIVLMAKLKEE